MISRTLSLEGAIKFTRVSVYLAYSWPLPRDSTKWQIRIVDIFWTLSFLSSLALLAPLLISIYEYHDDPEVIMRSSVYTIAISNFSLKMIVCRIYRERTQILIHEMLDFLKMATLKEREMLEIYMKRCWGYHATLTIIYYLTATIMICGPLLLPQSFPTDAVYPFNVLSSPLVRIIVYAHQAFAGFQCSTGLTMDFQPALLLWYAGARLELLAEDAKCISNRESFDAFVAKHQQLLWYANEVKTVIRYVTFTTAAITGIGTAFGLLQLISPQPLLVKLQFASVVVSSGMNLYSCAWPADNLTTVCRLVGDRIYNSAWPSMPPRLARNCVIVQRMCQKPVIVSVAGFVPSLSLEYYGMFLTKAFSYFTTLRVTMDVNSA